MVRTANTVLKGQGLKACQFFPGTFCVFLHIQTEKVAILETRMFERKVLLVLRYIKLKITARLRCHCVIDADDRRGQQSNLRQSLPVCIFFSLKIALKTKFGPLLSTCWYIY